MTTNKLAIYITILFVVSIITIPTIKKVININLDKKYYVNEKLIKESALDCYYDEKCKNNITLKELYDKGYLETKIFDPKTKANYNEESYVEITKEGVNFYLK